MVKARVQPVTLGWKALEEILNAIIRELHSLQAEGSGGITVNQTDDGTAIAFTGVPGPSTCPDGTPAGWCQRGVCIGGVVVQRWFWGSPT